MNDCCHVTGLHCLSGFQPSLQIRITQGAFKTHQRLGPTPDQLSEARDGALALIRVSVPPVEANVQQGREPRGQAISQDPSGFKTHQAVLPPGLRL